MKSHRTGALRYNRCRQVEIVRLVNVQIGDGKSTATSEAPQKPQRKPAVVVVVQEADVRMS